MTSSPIPAARSQYLLDLLAQVPDPRKRRGRRHALAGLLATGIAAVIAGSRSFAAIGQWAADASPEVLAGLGAARGPAEESTFRRAFALVSADVLDRALGAWLWTRAVQSGGRLVIAIDGKTVRGARSKTGKAPHLVAALAHGIGAVLGQVAVEEKSNEIPAVRELLKAFADLAGAVFTIDAMHTQHDTAQAILARQADYVMTVKANMPALYRQLKKLPWAAVPAFSAVSTDHGRRARRTIKAALAPAAQWDSSTVGHRWAAPDGPLRSTPISRPVPASAISWPRASPCCRRSTGGPAVWSDSAAPRTSMNARSNAGRHSSRRSRPVSSRAWTWRRPGCGRTSRSTISPASCTATTSSPTSCTGTGRRPGWPPSSTGRWARSAIPSSTWGG